MFFDLSTQMKLTQSFFDAATANAALAGTLVTSAVGQSAETCTAILSPTHDKKRPAKTSSKRSVAKTPARATSEPVALDLFTPWLRMFEPQAATPAVPANPMFGTEPLWQLSALPAWSSFMSAFGELQPTSAPASPFQAIEQWTQMFPWAQPAPPPSTPATLAFDTMAAMTKAAWPAQTQTAANPFAVQAPEVLAPFLANAGATRSSTVIPTLLTLSATCLSMVLPLIVTELQRMTALPTQQLDMFSIPAMPFQLAA